MRKNFSLGEKVQKFSTEDLQFVTSSNRIKSMIGVPYPEKCNQIHFRQRMFMTNIRGIIILSNKKATVGKVRQLDIQNNIDIIIEKSKLNLLEIEKFKIAAEIDNNPVIQDYEEYTAFIKDKLESPLEDAVKKHYQEKVFEGLLERIILDNSDFFTKFVDTLLKANKTSVITPLLQSVARDHGYKIVRVEDEVEV